MRRKLLLPCHAPNVPAFCVSRKHLATHQDRHYRRHADARNLWNAFSLALAVGGKRSRAHGTARDYFVS